MADLVNTLENPGEFDALTKLRPGEPYFALLGRDRFAPDLVMDWADRHRRKIIDEYNSGRIDREERDRELRKATQAEMTAASMKEYKAGHEEIKSEPTQKPSYSGHKLPEDAAKSGRLSRQRTDARSSINNVVSELTDLLPMLEDDLIVAIKIDNEIEHLRKLSDLLTPTRPIGDR